jgi:hypothetical protein
MQVHKAPHVPAVSQNSLAILCCELMVLILRFVSYFSWKKETSGDGALRPYRNHSLVMTSILSTIFDLVAFGWTPCLGDSNSSRCCWSA